MTTTPPEAPSGPPGHEGPRVTRDELRDLGRLRRSRTDRKLAGVAGGLARHLDIDPLILRVAFVVLAFFGGAGLILYGACWLLVPEEGSDDAPLGLDERSRSVALIVVGILAGVALLGSTSGFFDFPWPLALVAVVVLLLVSRKDSGRTTAPAAQVAPGASTAPAPPGGPWTAPSAVLPRPGNPRRRGPILFWFTLALIALGVGVLGIVDLAGVDVAASAYPATAVAITGLMLVVGAFYGRAGGLILVGLVATVAMAGASAGEHWDGTSRHEVPTTSADVDARYQMQTGEIVLDLTHVRDLQGLDGRRITLRGDVGRLEVIVPGNLDVVVDATVDGPGDISLFGDHQGGIDTTTSAEHDGGTAVPALTIDAQVGVGEITVSSQ